MAINKAKNNQTTLSKLRHYAKHIFIPHKGNDYRPHLIRISGLSVILAVIVVIQLGYGLLNHSRTGVLGLESNISASDLLTDTNQQRQAANLKPLDLSEQLDQAALLKVKDMFANQYWDHTSPSGVTPWKWLTDVGYNYDVAGENLAKNFSDAGSIISAWMASPSHRANILNDKYTQVGFAVADGTLKGENATIIVAFYGLPTSVLAAKSPPQQYTSNIGSDMGGPLTRFGIALRSLNPAMLGTVAILVVVIFVSAAAHHYRYLLPKKFQNSWRRHHGAIKMLVACLLILALLALSSGGQI